MNRTTLRLAAGLALAIATAPVAHVRAHEEPAVLPPQERGWESSVALGLTATSGNSETLLITGSLDTRREWERDIWVFGARVAYGKSEGEKSAEKAAAFGDYQHLFNERLYASLRISGEHDAVADLEYRFVVGPNLGYYFIKSDRTRLNAEIGPAYVIEKKDVITGPNPVPPPANIIESEVEDYVTLRLAERFDRQLTPGAKIWQSLELLPQVDDWENFLAIAEIGVEAALNKSLSLRLVLQDKYDNQPAAGRRRNDVTLIGALAYKF